MLTTTGFAQSKLQSYIFDVKNCGLLEAAKDAKRKSSNVWPCIAANAACSHNALRP